MSKSLSIRCSLLTGLSFLFVIPSQAQVMFMGLGDLPGGGVESKAFGLSADGTLVVGSSESGNGTEAFQWTSGSGMAGLGDLPFGGFSSIARAVTPDGSTIVGEGESDIGREPVIWTIGVGVIGLGHALPVDPGWSGGAQGVSDDGMVVVGNATAPGGGRRGFRWNAGPDGVTGSGDDEIDFYPDKNVVFAVSADGALIAGAESEIFCHLTSEATRWSGTVLQTLGHIPNGRCSQGFDISPDGQVVVGRDWDYTTDITAFRWTSAGGMVALDASIQSEALAASEGGGIVVGHMGAPATRRAFVWDAFNGVRDLAGELTDLGLDLTGWTLVEATDVSADGSVVAGWGINPTGDTEAWIARRADPDGPSFMVPGLGPVGIVVLAGLLSASAGLRLRAAMSGSRIRDRQGTGKRRTWLPGQDSNLRQGG